MSQSKVILQKEKWASQQNSFSLVFADESNYSSAEERINTTYKSSNVYFFYSKKGCHLINLSEWIPADEELSFNSVRLKIESSFRTKDSIILIGEKLYFFDFLKRKIVKIEENEEYNDLHIAISKQQRKVQIEASEIQVQQVEKVIGFGMERNMLYRIEKGNLVGEYKIGNKQLTSIRNFKRKNKWGEFSVKGEELIKVHDILDIKTMNMSFAGNIEFSEKRESKSCYLINIVRDELLDNRAINKCLKDLENKPSYALYNSKIYYISQSNAILDFKKECPGLVSSLGLGTPNASEPATEEQMKEICQITGHTPDYQYYKRRVYSVKEDVLGEGGYGSVTKVTNSEDNKEYALKSKREKKQLPTSRDIFLDFTTELTCLVELRGGDYKQYKKNPQYRRDIKNVKVTGIQTLPHHMHIQGNLSYLMDLYDGNIEKYGSREKNKADFPLIESMISQVIQGIATLHEKGWVHRDLFNNASPNILYKKVTHEEYIFHIADFGIAKKTKNIDYRQRDLTGIAYIICAAILSEQFYKFWMTDEKALELVEALSKKDKKFEPVSLFLKNMIQKKYKSGMDCLQAWNKVVEELHPLKKQEKQNFSDSEPKILEPQQSKQQRTAPVQLKDVEQKDVEHNKEAKQQDSTNKIINQDPNPVEKSLHHRLYKGQTYNMSMMADLISEFNYKQFKDTRAQKTVEDKRGHNTIFSEHSTRKGQIDTLQKAAAELKNLYNTEQANSQQIESAEKKLLVLVFKTQSIANRWYNRQKSNLGTNLEEVLNLSNTTTKVTERLQTLAEGNQLMFKDKLNKLQDHEQDGNNSKLN